MQVVIVTVGAILTWRNFSVALVLDESLQLFNAVILQFYVLFCFSVDSVICIKFFLQLYDSFVSLIEPRSKSNHDVSLLEEQLLVPVHLLLVLLYLDTFLLDLLHLLVEFFSQHPLLLFQGDSELGGVLDLFTTNEHLGVHGVDLGFEHFLLLLFLHELS